MKRVNGFTLIETIIASGVIVFGVLGILSLNTNSLIATQSTEAEFAASLFAREAIETVRAIRDANWLAYDTDSTTTWNTNLVSGTDYTAILQDPINGVFLDFSSDAFTDVCTGAASATYACTAIWLDPTTNSYYQTNSSSFDPRGATAVATAYRRLVTLNPICRSTTVESDERIAASGDECTVTEKQVGIHSSVEVQYPLKGSVATYILEEQLYDWKF